VNKVNGTLALLLCLSGGSVPAAVTGDLNADGSVDLSDAIALLNHLFLGGRPPAAFDPAPGLPVTGVTTCYADDLPVACPAPGMPFHGQDGNYRAGRPRDFDIVQPVPGDPATWYTVDYATGLVWQYLPDPRRKTWREALHEAWRLELGGHDDWRLPNISELLSLLSFEPGGPVLDPAFFALELDDPRYTTFWSATTFPVEGVASEGLVVDFGRGTVHTSAKDPGYQPAYARAVRSLPPLQNGDLNGDGNVDLSDAVRLLSHLFLGAPGAELRGPVRGLPATGQIDCFDASERIACASLDVDESAAEYSGQDGHVRAGASRSFTLVKPDPTSPSTWYTVDRGTGLAWQYGEHLVPLTFKGALQYCESLELGGFDDWRLPNVRELQSIADYGRYPSVDPAFFGVASRGLEGGDNWEFWTASPGLNFYMDIGFIARGFPETNWVRAVRTVD
jgi:hypothetical protein